MFDLLFDYFSQIINTSSTNVTKIFRTPTGIVDGSGGVLTFHQWLVFTMALISEIIIIVLCCLFIAKIVKLFGKLFSGGTL